jgi:hypothetical protein
MLPPYGIPQVRKKQDMRRLETRPSYLRNITIEPRPSNETSLEIAWEPQRTLPQSAIEVVSRQIDTITVTKTTVNSR